MDYWAPNLRSDFDIKSVELTKEEAFILYQLDGQTTVKNLMHLTSLPRARVREALLKLYLAGALVDADIPDDIAREARLLTEGLVETDEPMVIEGLEAPPEIAFENTAASGEGGFSDKLVTEEQLAAEELALLREEEAIERGEVRPKDKPARETRERSEEDMLFREVTSKDLGGEDLEEARQEAPPAKAPTPTVLIPEDPPDIRAQRMAQLRAMFKQEFASLPTGQRLAAARTAEGEKLSALCFDPDPATTNAVLNNPKVSVVHYRLLATQTRNVMVLDHLAGHPHFGQDPHLRRYLLGNKRSSDALYQSLFDELSMGEIVQLALGDEISDRAKRTGMQALRKMYQHATPEQRLEILLDTDGACLHNPLNLNLDTRTAALLVETAPNSSGLAHNLAKYPGTPTHVIRHLLHSPLARTSPVLRKKLQQHPNARR